MDIIDQIKETGSNFIDSAGEVASNIFEGIKETTDAILNPIDTLLGSWGTDLLEGSMNIANKMTFEIPNIEFINTITNVFVFVTTTFAICIVLFKVVEAQIQASNGSGEAVTARIIQKLFYSSIGLAIMPWAMNYFIKKIVAPIGEYAIMSVVSQLDADVIGERLRNFLVTNFFSGGVSAIVLFIFVIFFAFSIAMYFIAICVFYADFLVLTMLTPLVALSLLTDDQNYYQIWLKEILSESLTMLIKLILYVVMVSLMISDSYTLANFMVMLGCGLLIVKTPSALQNMWYSTKVAKGGGISNLAMMAMFKK